MASENTPLLSSASDKPIEIDLELKSDSSESSEKKAPQVPFRALFRFVDNTDKVLLVLAVIGSCLYGIISPLQFIVFGSLTDDFVDYTLWTYNVSTVTEEPDLEDSMTTIAYWYVGIAVANFGFAWMGLGLFGLAAQRQAYKMRLAMFRNVIYQEIGWFDAHSSGELNVILSDEISTVADGIGYKLGNMVSSLVSLIAGYAIAFTYCWQLSLVLAALFPLMVFLGGMMSNAIGKFTALELASYGKAGHIAEQSISSIRTVAAFGGEHKQSELYNEHLGDASSFAIKKGRITGIFLGIFMFSMYLNYGIAIWYLIHLVKDGDVSPGDGLTAFFAITVTASVMGQTATSAQAMAAARTAGHVVLDIIDRQSNIDASSNIGLKPVIETGEVEFSNIDFYYPTRESVQILKDFNLKIPSGKRVALVGESGCGKSTIVKLVERFYDPARGTVFVDGHDIRDITVNHLRKYVGIVNQEPVLFSTSIAENIAFGGEGITQSQIEEAAKMANAHDFITRFPQGYQTQCGERGAKMSGGQKQRIAIARALVRNPKILLLDEATSALDSESEAVVQEALDRAGEGRTTIVIAHRLSTIKNADMIVAVREGQVAETGTHDELMALDDLYSSLVKLQGNHHADDDDDEHDDADDIMDKDVADKDGAFQLQSILTVSTEFRSKKTQAGEEIPSVPYLAILTMNAPEWKELIVGCIGAGLWGAYPFLYGIAFGKIYEAFGKDTTNEEQRDEMDDDAIGLLIFYLCIAVGTGFGACIRDWFLAKAGEPLTQRLRELSFSAYLRQEASYFDVPSHGTGAICTSLATEISTVKGVSCKSRNPETHEATNRCHALLQQIALCVQSSDKSYALIAAIGCSDNSPGVNASTFGGWLIKLATGPQLGMLLGAFVSVVGGLIVALLGSWKLTLVTLAFMPILFIGGMITNRVVIDLSKKDTESHGISSAGQAADEALANIQTVVSLGKEDEFFERYRTALYIPYKSAKRGSQFSGMATGAMMGTVSIALAVVFRYGGHLVNDGDVTVKDMMTSVITVLVTAIIVGQVVSLTPDYKKAKQAADRVFHLLGSVPHIDCYSDAGKQPSLCQGEIDLADVRFRYPTRRDIKVLRNFNLSIKPGQTIALVGTSGCGKSTTVALVERLYDINSGSLTIDGNDVRELNLKWLRSQIGIVSQEPVLFDRSIRDNIAYGDTTRTFSDKEIIEAARSANIHDFISSLPKGYETIVGDKGTLISGGQKQRIAIARALIRNPKILLLDEATSALDTESEKVVQEALDKASIGRTTLIIAHRLSTIHHADSIVVIRQGKVIEQGTHQQLLALKGIYHALHKAQSLGRK